MKLVIVTVALLAICGGGFYGYNRDYYGSRGFGGGMLVLVVALILLYFLFGSSFHTGSGPLVPVR